MVYEYSLKVKDVHMTGLRGILTLRGMPIWIMPTRYLIQKLSKNRER